MFICQGAEDIQTPAALAAEYFGKHQGPHKKQVLLPGGGHFAAISLRDPFLRGLRTHIRPLAVAPDAPRPD